MTIWLLLIGVFASVVLHEAAHALVASSMGWDVVGPGLTWSKVGVRVKTESKEIAQSAWMVAIAGPVSNVLFGEGLLLLHTQVTTALGYFNLLVAAINLLPIPGSDGSVILKSLREELE